MWLQTVKFIVKKVKMCWFRSRIWFFCTKFVQLARGWYKAQHSRASPKKSVINWTWLQLSISDWSIVMIRPGGLQLVVLTYMQFQSQFYWWGCSKKKKAKLRHLILLSRVTYWALVEMLLHYVSWGDLLLVLRISHTHRHYYPHKAWTLSSSSTC
jgi:hypothetical protein